MIQQQETIYKKKKSPPQLYETTPEKDKDQQMDIQIKKGVKLTFKDLPQQIIFYITQVFPFHGTRLFITGIMENGQTINLITNQSQRQLYFCLKYPEGDEQAEFSEYHLEKAKRQISARLERSGISNFYGQFVEKQYVFEIQTVPRQKRPYFQVRFPFKIDCKDEPKPDWQGQTYRHIFGTTYTPLELFILNTGIKGPNWAKIQKKYLSPNTKNVEHGLCAQLQDPQLIEVDDRKNKPSTVRAMSISIKAVVPSQLNIKKYFKTNRIDDLHIYAISYLLVDDYNIEAKPNKYNSISRTFYLKQFGSQSSKELIVCVDEKQMLAMFYSDLCQYDPDVIVCHDASKILDTLIQRMMRLNDKHEKPKLGRLIFAHQVSTKNQYQRISSTVAGRLVADTYIHSKDMLKSIDYELQSMAKHIKPQRKFQGMTDQEAKSFLNDNKAFFIIRKIRQQAEITFALMNHLQVLQTTRQLSNICGNIWKRSLENQRAERNQYLIMHDCVKRNLLIPDKFKKYKNQEDDGEEDDVDRKKYQGGYVIEPKKGIYGEFTLLLDFNSLYPSIIREYNVCFSVIKRPLMPLSYYFKSKDNKDKKKNIDIETEEMQVMPPPKSECTKEKWGFLPHLIDKIVARRKHCKKLLKNTKQQEKKVILDIQQKCYKLVANSIYGCLGFSISRFYSKHLASLITRMGRESLLRAKDIVENMPSVDVIYGDTDSLMILPQLNSDKTEKEKLFELKGVAQQLKKLINKQYTNLQIDIDGIFKPLLLLMKKKYVARKLQNFDNIIEGKDQELHFQIQYKGIEVVRRDGFELARRYLKDVLNILMNTNKTQADQICEEIYEYNRNMKGELSKLSYKDFLFSKQLNKHPDQYKNADTMPHVKVAKDRIKAGEKAQSLVNHTIYYIVCEPKDGKGKNLAQNCYSDNAYSRSLKYHEQNDRLKIDEQYYKKEMLQPVARIFCHLENFKIERLCEDLGISDENRKKFKKQIMDLERDQGYADIEGFMNQSKAEKSKKLTQQFGQIQCKCGQKVQLSQNGCLKVQCACGRCLLPTIQNRIQFTIKTKIHSYYSNKYKCKCNKQYQLTPIYPCCKINHKPRTNLLFEMHQMIYLAKDLANMTIKEKKMSEENKKRVVHLEAILDEFLENSEYEKVDKIMNIFAM